MSREPGEIALVTSYGLSTAILLELLIPASNVSAPVFDGLLFLVARPSRGRVDQVP